MNREAAALGIPVYSIFRGPLGAVDKYLAENGRLVMIETQADLETKIRLVKRPKEPDKGMDGRMTLKQVMNAIEEVLNDVALS